MYYVYYRSRRPGDGDTEWEEQVVETVNNTINHMVGNNTINHMVGGFVVLLLVILMVMVIV